MAAPIIGRKRELKYLPVDSIIKNELNPREEQAFTPGELDGLRASVRDYGTLQPVIVTPYDDDMYKLIDGERRWTSAKLEGVKEIPAIIVGRMSGTDQLNAMFQAHMHHRPWEILEEVAAIRQLKEANPGMSIQELAVAIGIPEGRLHDRLRLMVQPPATLRAVAQGEITPTAAIRVGRAVDGLASSRPGLVDQAGGRDHVNRQVLAKARLLKDSSGELERALVDIRDTDSVPDDAIRDWIAQPDVRLTEARRRVTSLPERRAVEDLTKDVARLEKELKRFRIDLSSAPNLRDLRGSLGKLAQTAFDLERRVSAAMIEAA